MRGGIPRAYPREDHMANRTPQDASVLAGVQLTFYPATVTTGDTTVGGPGIVLLIRNASGGSINCVLTTPETIEGTLTVQDRSIACATAQTTAIPVPARYNDSVTGLATFICSAVTSVDFAVLRTAVS